MSPCVVQGPGDFGTQALTALLQALVPALLMNICIVGMNQIFDVEIDKINKPYLPLACGEWSLQTGIRVAVSTGLLAVLLSLYIGSKPLLATVIGSLLLGIAYSVDLPFLRWKKYPILAMGCILSVRYIPVFILHTLLIPCDPRLCIMSSNSFYCIQRLHAMWQCMTGRVIITDIPQNRGINCDQPV